MNRFTTLTFLAVNSTEFSPIRIRNIADERGVVAVVFDEYSHVYSTIRGYIRRRPGRQLPLPSRDDQNIRREVLLHEGSPEVIEGSCVCTAKSVWIGCW